MQRYLAATAVWGHITHFAGMSAASGGNCFFHGEFTVHKDIDIGDILEIAAGELDIRLD